MSSKWVWILGVVVLGGGCLIIGFTWLQRPNSSTPVEALVSAAPTKASTSATAAGPESFVLGDKIAAAVLPTGHAVPLLRVKDAANKPDDAPPCVTAVAVDLNGHPWIGMQDGSICMSDAAGSSFYSFQAGDHESLDPVTALAVDRHGRIWAGRAVNGVSVFDGHAWHAYGLLDGPLGEHVNKIAISPINGDVWLATNRGLSRFADATGEWSYITRGQGLPSDDVVGIAFDSTGTLFAATADNGVAIAHASDDYVTWTTVHNTEDLRGRAGGGGLSSDWCSDVCVIGSNVFVGTTAGLSCSRDGGETWSFVRGKNWINKALLAINPPAEVTKDSPPGVLADDAVTCLGSDEQGKLLVGHALAPADVLDPATLVRIKQLSSDTAGAWAITCSGPAYIAASSKGLVVPGGKAALPEESAEADPSTLGFAKSAADAGAPASAKPPTAAALRAMTAAVKSLPAPTAQADVLGTDWVTGGDYWGRYGWDYRSTPYFGSSASDGGISSNVMTGPHIMKGDGVYTDYASIDTNNPRSLFFFYKNKREQGEWNDASWKGIYKPDYEGPDLWFRVKVPAGPHRVSLYLINNDPDGGNNRWRDFLVELKGDAPNPASADATPALAKIRSRHFEQGFYANFQVGAGTWWIKVGRNASFCTKVSALLVDNLAHRSIDAMMTPDTRPIAESVDLRPRWDGQLNPPSETATAALELWRALDAARDRDARVDMADRLLAIRALDATPGNESLKAFFHAAVPVWSEQDRQHWADAVSAAEVEYAKVKAKKD